MSYTYRNIKNTNEQVVEFNEVNDYVFFKELMLKNKFDIALKLFHITNTINTYQSLTSYQLTKINKLATYLLISILLNIVLFITFIFLLIF